MIDFNYCRVSLPRSFGTPRSVAGYKAVDDVGWGTFTNFLAYKLERRGGKLVEIDRWFPSSKLCSNCFYQIGEMPLDVREWTCLHCNTHHNRDANAAQNIRAEGIRMLALSEAEMLKAEG